MNPAMPCSDCVLATIRARYWLHYWHQHILSLSKQFPDLYSESWSFISSPSFKIFNRLCDTLVILALVYTEYYPNIPFCPWLIDTGFVEHFFGIAQQLLPDFLFAELLKMIRHIMVQHCILESGLLKSKPERDSVVGYIYNHVTDMQSATKSPPCPADLTRNKLHSLIVLGHDEAVRLFKDILSIPIPKFNSTRPIVLAPLSYSSKTTSPTVNRPNLDKDCASDCDESILEADDYENQPVTEVSTTDTAKFTNTLAKEATASAESDIVFQELDSEISQQASKLGDIDVDTPMHSSESPSPTVNGLPQPDMVVTTTLSSSLLDDSGKISIRKLVEVRRSFQSGTSVKSERVFALSSKFTKLVKSEKQKMTPQRHLTIYAWS